MPNRKKNILKEYESLIKYFENNDLGEMLCNVEPTTIDLKDVKIIDERLNSINSNTKWLTLTELKKTLRSLHD